MCYVFFVHVMYYIVISVCYVFYRNETPNSFGVLFTKSHVKSIVIFLTSQGLGLCFR